MKLIIKKRIKKAAVLTGFLVTVIFLSIIFQGCEKNEGLDIENNDALLQILRDQIEISIKNSTKSASSSEYELFYKRNIYSDYTESLFSFAKKLKEDGHTESLKDLKIRFNKEISQIKTPECFNDKASEIDSKIYQEIVHHLKHKTEPEIIKIFNTVNRFANDFICDENQRERILYTSEALKFIYIRNNTDFSVPRLKSLTENSYGGYLLTDCQHWCVERILEDMDFLDWLSAATAPPLYAAAVYFHCVIVCN